MSLECIFKWQFNGFPGVPDFVSYTPAHFIHFKTLNLPTVHAALCSTGDFLVWINEGSPLKDCKQEVYL